MEFGLASTSGHRSTATGVDPQSSARSGRIVQSTMPRIEPDGRTEVAVRPQAALASGASAVRAPDLRQMLQGLRRGLALNASLLDGAQRSAHAHLWELMSEPDSVLLPLGPARSSGGGLTRIGFAISASDYRLQDDGEMDGERLPRTAEEHEYLVAMTHLGDWVQALRLRTESEGEFRVAYGMRYTRGGVAGDGLDDEQLRTQEHVWELISRPDSQVLVLSEHTGEAQTASVFAISASDHRVDDETQEWGREPLSAEDHQYTVTIWHTHGVAASIGIESRGNDAFLVNYLAPGEVRLHPGFEGSSSQDHAGLPKLMKNDRSNYRNFLAYVQAGRCVRADGAVVETMQAFRDLPVGVQSELVKSSGLDGGTLQAINRVELRDPDQQLTAPKARPTARPQKVRPTPVDPVHLRHLAGVRAGDGVRVRDPGIYSDFLVHLESGMAVTSRGIVVRTVHEFDALDTVDRNHVVSAAVASGAVAEHCPLAIQRVQQKLRQGDMPRQVTSSASQNQDSAPSDLTQVHEWACGAPGAAQLSAVSSAMTQWSVQAGTIARAPQDTPRLYPTDHSGPADEAAPGWTRGVGGAAGPDEASLNEIYWRFVAHLNSQQCVLPDGTRIGSEEEFNALSFPAQQQLVRIAVALGLDARTLEAIDTFQGRRGEQRLMRTDEVPLKRNDRGNYRRFETYLREGRSIRANGQAVTSVEAFGGLPLAEQNELLNQALASGLDGNTRQAINRVEGRPEGRKLTAVNSHLSFTAAKPRHARPALEPNVADLHRRVTMGTAVLPYQATAYSDFLVHLERGATVSSNGVVVHTVDVFNALALAEQNLLVDQAIDSGLDINARQAINALQRREKADRLVPPAHQNARRALQQEPVPREEAVQAPRSHRAIAPLQEAPATETGQDAIFIPASPESRGAHLEDERYR